MVGILAKCDNCDAVFESIDEDAFFGSSGITFENCGTRCIRCGRPARILDGTYDYDFEGVNGLILRYGPQETFVIAAAVRQAIAAAKARKSIDEIVEPIAKIDKSLAEKVRRVGLREGIAALMLLLSYILTGCEEASIHTKMKTPGFEIEASAAVSSRSAPRSEAGPQSTGTVETAQRKRVEEKSEPSRLRRNLQERRAKKLQKRQGGPTRDGSPPRPRGR